MSRVGPSPPSSTCRLSRPRSLGMMRTPEFFDCRQSGAYGLFGNEQGKRRRREPVEA